MIFDLSQIDRQQLLLLVKDKIIYFHHFTLKLGFYSFFFYLMCFVVTHQETFRFSRLKMS